jgi:hypothetical protein
MQLKFIHCKMIIKTKFLNVLLASFVIEIIILYEKYDENVI